MPDAVSLQRTSRSGQLGAASLTSPIQRPGGNPPPEPAWLRYRSALLRHKWLILGCALLGTCAAAVASRFVKPRFDVQATIWISSDTPQGRDTGPLRAEELLSTSAWPDLVRSFVILDPAVEAQALYLTPERLEHHPLFTGFRLSDRFRPGEYRLHIDPSGRQFTLLDELERQVERGLVGDSVGRVLGFQWLPDPAFVLPGQDVRFSVVTPREASVALRDKLSISLPPQSNLLRISLSGSDANRQAATLNTLIDEFVGTAARLKRRNHMEFATTLRQQLDYSERELRDAEIALENFRISTITLPSEAVPLAGGVDATRDPVLESFFSRKIERDELRFEQTVLERTIAETRAGRLDVSALWTIPSIQQGAPELKSALSEYMTKTAALRTLREGYTDEHPTVQELVGSLRELRDRTIPTLVTAFAAELSRRAADLDARIGSASAELRTIPTRTIEEMRLRRNVVVRQQLYTMLRQRYEEARLAEASALPDVSVLDSAVAPQNPSANTGPMLVLLGALVSLGLGAGLALALDRVDGRFRYPSQVTGDLGLEILGAVPSIRSVRAERRNPEETAQLVESFRSIRLNLCHAFGGPGPIVVTVSSPGVGDGKSLVCANLAMSFAESGARTVLVDGDIRRGGLHAMFGTTRRPGLIDYLAGESPIEAVLRPTGYDRLVFVPGGSRRQRGPELLSSPAFLRLLAELRARFDVVLIDSAPLGAGIDSFAIGAATGNLLCVFRSGTTDRGMAEAKLQIMDRLPVRMLGAVLNDVRAEGAYRYYSYLYGYVADEEGPVVSDTAHLQHISAAR